VSSRSFDIAISGTAGVGIVRALEFADVHALSRSFEIALSISMTMRALCSRERWRGNDAAAEHALPVTGGPPCDLAPPSLRKHRIGWRQPARAPRLGHYIAEAAAAVDTDAEMDAEEEVVVVAVAAVAGAFGGRCICAQSAR